MIPIRLSKALTAGVVDSVALSQTPGGAGNLTINGSLASGGVATFTTARRVLFTFAGADAARTFTLTGTNSNGTIISETVAGANSPSTSVSLRDYLTVTQIAVNAAMAGAIRVGTNGVGATDWQIPSREIPPVNMSFGVTVSGTVNYTVQYTYDSIQAPPGINQTVPLPTAWNVAALLNQAANADASIQAPIAAWRLLINSGTGTATIEAIQAGISGN